MKVKSLIRNSLLPTLIILGSCTLTEKQLPKSDMPLGTPERKIGYRIEELANDFYQITYTTPTYTAFDRFDDAWKMLNKKAGSLCDSEHYVLKEKSSGKHTDNMPGWLKTVSAKVDCTGRAEENLLASKKLEQQKELESLIKSASERPCSNYSSTELGMSVYEYATKLYHHKLYDQARECFMSFVDKGEAHHSIYNYLGLMYEFGYGVKQDIAVAKEWYKKAELQ